MNKRITEAFANGKAFIPFLTCGDPSLEVTEQLVYAMEEAGADLIELGIPFSDPTAEGPVIQEANVRAFAGGVTTDKVFSMVEKIRKNTKIPMVFMTYANVVFSYGTERFIKKAAEVGMDGLILPDVPFEEKEEFDVVCKQYGLDLISLIAPTSHERIAMIAKGGRLCLLRIFPWCNRNAYQHYHRYRSYGEISKSSERHSMCSRIRNLHTGAGKKNGRSVRRCHCRICDREALWCLRQRLRAEGEGLCERDEGCDQISSRLKLEHRSQSVIKICFIPKKG